ncbi:MAG: saccharopine dehydrogenase NADP-binding domain-containing protein, partial [Gaiellales bacterium]
MIAVVGAAGTIGRNVARFLDGWGAPLVRRDARLEGEEQVDPSDSAAVAAALDGSAVCVNCADYRLNASVMRGALDAGAHYVDLGGLYHVTKLQLEFDSEFRERGLGALLGMGSAPGKANLMASAAVARLEEDPRSLEIWAATRDPAAEGHPFPAPYSVRTLLDELSMAPVVVEDGQALEVEPLSGEATRVLPDARRGDRIWPYNLVAPSDQSGRVLRPRSVLSTQQRDPERDPGTFEDEEVDVVDRIDVQGDRDEDARCS